MSKRPFLSIIIPLYNESMRVHNLSIVSSFIKTKKSLTELIVVNDGSTDDTLIKLKSLKSKFNLKILSYLKNKGKGYAIKKGFLEAQGQYILFTDIDLSTPIEEIDKFIPFTKSYDIIIATRKVAESKVVSRQLPLRENLGKVFTALSKIILNLNLSDFTCGFKLFSRKAGKEIFSKLTTNRWGFDSELLFIAKKKGFRIKEVGVQWKNDPSTKVKFPQDVFTSLIELIKVRINEAKGVYG